MKIELRSDRMIDDATCKADTGKTMQPRSPEGRH